MPSKSPSPSAPVPRRKRRWLRWIAGGTLLLVGVYLARGWLIGPWLASLLESAVKDALGVEVEVGAVRGSYFASLEVVDLRTRVPAPDQGVNDLAATRLQATYSLRALVAGEADWLRSVTAEDLRVDLDIDRLPDTETSALPDRLPTLDVRGGALRLCGEGWSVAAEGVTARAVLDPDSGPSASRLDVQARSCVATGGDELRLHGALDATGRYESARVTLDRLVIGDHDLVRRLSLDLSRIQEGRFGAEAELSVADGRVRTEAEMDPAGWSGHVQVEALDLERLRELVSWNGAVAGRLQMDLVARLPDSDREPADVKGTATLDRGRWQLLDELGAELRFHYTDGQLLDTELRVHQPQNSVTLRSDRVLVPTDLATWPDDELAVECDVTLAAPRALAVQLGLHWDETWPLLQTLHANLAVTPRALTLPRLDVTAADDHLGLTQVHVDLPPKDARTPWVQWLDELSRTTARAEATLHVTDLRRTLSPWEVELPATALDLEAQLEGPLEQMAFSVQVRAAAATQDPDAWPATVLAGDGRLDSRARRLSLRHLQLDQERTALTATDVVLAWPVGDSPWWQHCRGTVNLDTRDLEGWLRRTGVSIGPEPSASLPAELAEDAQLRLAGTFDAGQVSVLRAHFQQQDTVVELDDVQSTLDDSGRPQDLSGRLRVQSPDLSDLSVLPGVPPLQGRAEARLTMAGTLAQPALQADVTVSGLAVDGRPLGDLVVRGALRNHDLLVERLQVTGTDGDVTASGTAHWNVAEGRFEVELRQLDLSGRDQALALRDASHLTVWNDGRLQVDSLVLEGLGGAATISGDYDPEGAADLTVQVRDLRPTEALHSWLPDAPRIEQLALLDLTVNGPPGERQAHLAMRMLGASLGKLRPLDVDVEATLAGQILDVHHVHVESGDERLIFVHGTVPLAVGGAPFADGPLDLSVLANIQDASRFVGHAPWSPAIPSLEGTLFATGTWTDPEVRLEVKGQGLGLRADAPLTLEPADLAVEAALVDGTVRLARLELSSTQSMLSVQGLVVDALDFSAFPHVALDRSASADATVELQVPGLGWLAGEESGLRRLAGAFTASFQLQGTLESPDLTGEALLEDGQLRLATSGVPSWTALQGRFRFRGTDIVLEHFTGEMGAAPFELSGKIALDADFEPELDLALRGQELLLYRSGGVKLRADADLRIQGPFDRALVSGRLAISDGRLTRTLNLMQLALDRSVDPIAGQGLQLFSLTEPPGRDARFDIEITARNPFRIQSRLLQSALRPELTLHGTGELPFLVGTVYLDSTAVSLPLCTFRVDHGTVRFPAADPFRPLLEMTARTRMLGYDVQATVTGPFDEPVVYLSSTPPCTHEDLLLLVVAGRLPDARDDYDSESRALGSVAVYLGRDLLDRLMDDESTETTESVLGRFEYESGRNLSRRGEETFEARFRLLDDVFLSNDSLSIEVERSEFDEYNAALRLVFRLR